MTQTLAKVWIVVAAVGIIVAGTVLAALHPEMTDNLRTLGIAVVALLFCVITIEAIRVLGDPSQPTPPITTEGVLTMSLVISADGTPKGVAVVYKDKHGNITVPPSPPVWSVSDPALLSVTPAADGMSASIVAVGPIGSGTVTATLGSVSSTPLAVQIDAGAPATGEITPTP